MKVNELGNRTVSGAIREAISRMARPHSDTATVARRKLPYWQERGWQREGELYRGTYQTDYGAWVGNIVPRSANHYEVFILHPPQALQGHKHWTCFQPRNNGWYNVHLHRHPSDASSAIMAVEQVLREAFEL